MLCTMAMLALLAPAICFAQNRSILPADRQTTWRPGIPGGIPDRATICATVNASSYGNGSSNATSGIQSAIDSCPVGQVVLLSAGTFQISSGPIYLNRGVVLRGAGPTQTTLNAPDGKGQAIVVIGQQWPKEAGSTNLTSDAVKGAKSVTVASTTGLSAGQLVLIDAITDPAITLWATDCSDACKGWFSRTNRPVSQTMEIASISGKTVAFTTPFHITFDMAHTAQLTRYSVEAVRGAGLENLKLYGGEGGDSGGNVYMELAMYSWVKNIESQYSLGSSLHIYRSFRNTVRDSYWHETKNPNPGGAGYGIDISSGSSDNLFENNISWNFNKVILMRASGGGNVIGYNYFEDGYGATYPTFVETGLNASHMTTPHYELFEGNEAFNLGGDSRWGNSVFITFFRNHSTTIRRSLGGLKLSDVGARAGVAINAGHRYYSFIGNVIGYEGMSPQPAGSSFTYEDTAPYSGDPVPMWRFGEWVTGAPSAYANGDPEVAATTLRDGNYDYVSQTVKWDRTATTLPDSLYLTGKPAFMGTCAWPWVDPTGTTKLHTLPARARFDGNPDACGTASQKTPNSPTNLRIDP
jgi:hypothetical protein